MNTAGVVCEYNPFHNGHRYHLEETRKRTGCDGIIAVMSGNFVQRGEPAVFDKHFRAHTAILGGADLVLELPAASAVQSAEFFARNAVFLLQATGVVSHLSFGAEAEDLTVLQETARLLLEEPEDFKQPLKEGLACGMSFPRARCKALQAVLGESAARYARQPNNLLAIEYLKALENLRASMIPVLVPRIGAEHNSMTSGSGFASASLLRTLLREKNPAEELYRFLPEFYRQIKDLPPVKELDNFGKEILIRLCEKTFEELRALPEVSEGLEFKIHSAAWRADTPEAFLQEVKSKRYPLSRLRRILIYALLGFCREEQRQLPPYLKILDFNDRGQKILHEMKKKATLPIVKHTGHVRKRKDPELLKFWERELFFDRVYHLG